MKHLFALTLAAGIGLAGVSEARAATPSALPQVTAPASVQLVSGGCGPRGFRDRYGRCRPIGYVPPPRYRRCPPGLHPTPYGCRRNF